MTPVVPPYRRGEGFGTLGLRFAEVTEPAPVSLRPETLGAWITLGVLVLVAALALAWLVRRQLRGRYRRAAERELAVIGAAWAADRSGSAALEAVPVLLKRCALHGVERTFVAPLSGEPWLRFLDATGRAPFGEAAGRALLLITTRGAGAVSREDAASLLSSTRRWIRRHRARV